MNRPGDADLLTAARSALLDALGALQPHLHAVVVIGAQAIYLHTGGAAVALAETTKDSDIALDTRVLPDTPLLEDAMRQAGFHLGPSGTCRQRLRLRPSLGLRPLRDLPRVSPRVVHHGLRLRSSVRGRRGMGS